ncbi:VOC family protein [Mucilaginibacter limnophilus]|uniref:VOC family protein n=1 Tax=Mucilaginibacter limnophilus TaxID=1932778 RepID=A0A3S2XYH3_9SPHI|nr:VOC family protein [Mucilaginibacter limnophilus]RVT98047.1 VOC family protein [Mucilaginibacter limnophilus]
MASKITGFGGFFFRSKDSKALAKWYEDHFGINSMQSGTVWRQQEGTTVFAPFKHDTTYFGRPEQQFMLNFRVTDLDALLEELKAAGVKIDESRHNDEIGKFAWVYDPEDNKIELWEPTEETK